MLLYDFRRGPMVQELALRIVVMVLTGFLFQIMEVEQIIVYNLERRMRILTLEII